MKTVVAALIEKDGKYLLAKRKMDGPLGGLWEFPGGKVEPEESDTEALKREIIEEFNTIVDVGKLLATAEINENTILKLYECKHNLGGYHAKEHSEVVWLDNVTAAINYDLAPADIKLLKKLTNDNRRPSLKELVIGNSYTNDDIQRIYLVSSQGGMRKSNRANSLILFALHNTSNPYKDNWGKDGIMHYTGMGLSGNQSIDYAQNKTLSESHSNGVDIHLFESHEPREYIYRGRVKLTAAPYYITEKDKDGKERQVIKFPLKLLG
jgi:mutator protein MutT